MAAGLSAFHLTWRSLWLDESASIAIASQHGVALWHAISHDGGNMLGYYLLLHVLIGWFGPGEAVVRLPSLLADAATAAFTAGLAWRLSGQRRVALGAGLLTAVSLPLVFWGQDARGYALMVALSTGALLAFTAIVQIRGRAPRLAIVAYVILSVLSLYMSFYAGLIILAELAVLPAFRHRARLIIGCLVLVGAASIPLLVLAEQRGPSQLFWVDQLTPAIAAKAGAVLISAGFPPNFHVTAWTILAAAVTLPLAVALAARLVTAARSRPAVASPRPERPAGAGWIAASWVLVPTVVMLAAALAGEPVELARAILLVVPAVGVLFALGLHHRYVAPTLGLAGLAVLLAVRVLALVPTYHDTPENWQAAAAHLARAGRAGDCVLFYPEDARMPVDYYLRQSPAAAGLRPVLPTTPWRVVRPYVEDYRLPSSTRLHQIERSCPRLFVVAGHQGHKPGPAASVRDIARYRLLLTELHRGYPHASQRKFSYAAVVYVTRFWR